MPSAGCPLPPGRRSELATSDPRLLYRGRPPRRFRLARPRTLCSPNFGYSLGSNRHRMVRLALTGLEPGLFISAMSAHAVPWRPVLTDAEGGRKKVEKHGAWSRGHGAELKSPRWARVEGTKSRGSINKRQPGEVCCAMGKRGSLTEARRARREGTGGKTRN